MIDQTIIHIAIGAAGGLFVATAVFLAIRARMMSKMAILEERCKNFQDTVNSLIAENNELSEKIQSMNNTVIRQQAENESYLREVKQNKENFQKSEQALIEKFENLSNKIFDDKALNFKRQSQESLDQILNPLKEKIVDFERKVNDSFGSQAKESFSLKEQIKNIVQVNEKMTLQAENLVNALKGDSKTQGNWGEVMLEKILEDSGLRKGVDYVLQGGGMKLQDADGKRQYPDVIVNLPDNKHVIIDSKVTLTHYERLFAESDDEARQRQLKLFLKSVKDKIGELDQRRYQDTDQLGTPDFVLMFIPIEAAYILAIQEDTDIQNYAWDKKVVIVCPTTLFATLRTITSVWRLELQNKNALEIARQGGLLYDKVEGFVQDMMRIGKQLNTVTGSYDEAMKKLSEGRGTILSRTEKLKALGAKTSKSLPAELVDLEDDAVNDGGHQIEKTNDENAEFMEMKKAG